MTLADVFQSTLPAGEATFCPCSCGRNSSKFQSTLPAGEATTHCTYSHGASKISIHASRGGSDLRDSIFSIINDISIHASRGGSDGICSPLNISRVISIHASRGGSDAPEPGPSVHAGISIHASRGGSDRSRAASQSIPSNFNPRFPRGKRPLRRL